MFKRKYRIREKIDIDIRREFIYCIQVKYKIFPFIWIIKKESDNLEDIKYWYNRYLDSTLLTLEESDWI